jgi:hypothetical protein
MFVYKIDTKLTKEQAEDIYDNLTHQEIQDLESYKLVAYDVENNGMMTSYVVVNRYVLTRIILFLRQRDIDFDYEDISNSVLTGVIKFKDTPIEKEIIQFIVDNITVDNVLDKINQFGIDSLTETDKKCLESH